MTPDRPQGRGAGLSWTPYRRLSARRARRARQISADLGALRRAGGCCASCGATDSALAVVDGAAVCLAGCEVRR